MSVLSRGGDPSLGVIRLPTNKECVQRIRRARPERFEGGTRGPFFVWLERSPEPSAQVPPVIARATTNRKNPPSTTRADTLAVLRGSCGVSVAPLGVRERRLKVGDDAGVQRPAARRFGTKRPVGASDGVDPSVLPTIGIASSRKESRMRLELQSVGLGVAVAAAAAAFAVGASAAPGSAPPVGIPGSGYGKVLFGPGGRVV